MEPLDSESPEEERDRIGSGLDLNSTLKSTGSIASTTNSTQQSKYRELFLENKLTTITLCFVFWAFGTCVAFLGPTLLDLGCKTGTVFRTMSWVFFSQSFFILTGSACAGLLLRKLSRESLLLAGTAMMTVSMSSIPLCGALWALICVLAIMGFFMGTIDTVVNVSMISIYGRHANPFLQATHFFYGVGAFVSPMVVQPFLLNEDCSQFLSTDNSSMYPADDSEPLPASTLQAARRMTHVDSAFFIITLTMLPIVFLTVLLVAKKHCLILLGSKPTAEEEKDKEYENIEGAGGHIDPNRLPKNIGQVAVVIILSGILLFLYDGLQAMYGGYIYSYAVKGPVKFKKSDAAYLNALFWGMFAAGRLLSIVMATKFHPSVMLFCNIMGSTSSLFLMLALRYNHYILILGTCTLGIFMSSVFPTTLSLTEQYIHITPCTTTFLVFGAAFGEMILPVIVGHEFEHAGPKTFLVTGLVLCFLSIIAYMTLWLVGVALLKPEAPPGIMVFFTKYMPDTIEKIEGENTSLVNQNVQNYSRMTATSPLQSPDADGTINFVRKET